MACFLIFGVSDVTDSAELDRYAAAGAKSLGSHDFNFLAGPNAGELLEGDTPFQKFVVLEFPTREAAKAWYDSEEYQNACDIRRPVSKTFAMLIDRND